MAHVQEGAGRAGGSRRVAKIEDERGTSNNTLAQKLRPLSGHHDRTEGRYGRTGRQALFDGCRVPERRGDAAPAGP